MSKIFSYFKTDFFAGKDKFIYLNKKLDLYLSIYLVSKLVSESFIYHNQRSFVSFTAGKRPILILKVHATFIVTSKLFSDKVI